MHEFRFSRPQQPNKRPNGSEHPGTGLKPIVDANRVNQRPQPPKPQELHDKPPKQGQA